MIKCNEFILRQRYNVLATKNNKRVALSPTFSKTEVEITLFSMHQQDFRSLSQKEKFKEPIEFVFDGEAYELIDYNIRWEMDVENKSISQVVITGYIESDEQPEFDLID